MRFHKNLLALRKLMAGAAQSFLKRFRKYLKKLIYFFVQYFCMYSVTLWSQDDPGQGNHLLSVKLKGEEKAEIRPDEDFAFEVLVRVHGDPGKDHKYRVGLSIGKKDVKWYDPHDGQNYEDGYSTIFFPYTGTGQRLGVLYIRVPPEAEISDLFVTLRKPDLTVIDSVIAENVLTLVAPPPPPIHSWVIQIKDKNTKLLIPGATLKYNGTEIPNITEGKITLHLPGGTAYDFEVSAPGYITTTGRATAPMYEDETTAFWLTPGAAPPPPPPPAKGQFQLAVVEYGTTTAVPHARIAWDETTATADSVGLYLSPELDLGSYSVTVSKEGFEDTGLDVLLLEAGVTPLTTVELVPITAPPPPPPKTIWEQIYDAVTFALKDILSGFSAAQRTYLEVFLEALTGKDFDVIPVEDAAVILARETPGTNWMFVLAAGKDKEGNVQEKLKAKDYLDIAMTVIALDSLAGAKLLTAVATRLGLPRGSAAAADIYGNLYKAKETSTAKNFAVAARSAGAWGAGVSYLKKLLVSAGVFFPIVGIWWYLDNVPFYGTMAKKAGLLPADATEKIETYSIAFSKSYDNLAYAETRETAESSYNLAKEQLDAWQVVIDDLKAADPNFWQKAYSAVKGEELTSQYDYYKEIIDYARENLETAWADAQAKFPEIEKGSIEVVTVPEGADVYVDDVLNTYPSNTVIDDLEPKTYTVRVSLEGYVPYEDDIEVRAGKQEKFEHEFVKLVEKAYVEISTTPGFVEVWIDGKLVDYTDAKGKMEFSWPAGAYSFEFRKAGYHTEPESVELYEGRTKRIAVSLREIVVPPDTGVLTVSSDPPGVEIWKAGEKIGTTDDTGAWRTEIAPFIGDLNFKKEGYEDRRKSVSVWADKETHVYPVLTKLPEERWLWELEISAQDTEGNPLSPKIFINGSYTKKWAPDYILLEPGKWTIRLELKGYEPWEEEIDLEAI